MGQGNSRGKARFERAYETVERTMKFRYLGIGFVWAWIYCAFETSAVFPNRQGVGIDADASWVMSAAAVTIALFVLGISWRKISETVLRCACVVSPVIVSVGTLFAWFDAGGAVLNALGGTLTGIGSAGLCLLWAREFSFLDDEVLEVVVPMSSAVMVACAFVFPYLHGVVGAVAVASLPLISGVLIFGCIYDRMHPSGRAASKRPSTINTEAEHGSYLGSLVRPSIVLCIAYCAMGCASVLAPESTGSGTGEFDAPTLIGAAFGVAMAITFILYTVRIDFSSLFRWLIPLLVLALALSPWQTNALAGFVCSTIAAVSDTAMQALAYICAIRLACRRKVSPVLCVGITQGFVQLGVLVGNLVGANVALSVYSGTVEASAVMLVFICLLSFSSLLLPRMPDDGLARRPCADNAVEGNNLLRGVGRQVSATEADEPAPSISQIDRIAAELAATRGLSARETEILGYLARGRSQPYIREELYLSKNTVSTHVKHIYQKLAIHSREELLDLFEK